MNGRFMRSGVSERELQENKFYERDTEGVVEGETQVVVETSPWKRRMSEILTFGDRLITGKGEDKEEVLS